MIGGTCMQDTSLWFVPSSDSPCSRQHRWARGAAEHPECCHTRSPVQGGLLPRGSGSASVVVACSYRVLVIFPGDESGLFQRGVIRVSFVDQMLCFSPVPWCWHLQSREENLRWSQCRDTSPAGGFSGTSPSAACGVICVICFEAAAKSCFCGL